MAGLTPVERGIGSHSQARLVKPWAAGDRRSEVKEEGRAQRGPGDMSEGGCPLFTAAR